MLNYRAWDSVSLAGEITRILQNPALCGELRSTLPAYPKASEITAKHLDLHNCPVEALT